MHFKAAEPAGQHVRNLGQCVRSHLIFKRPGFSEAKVFYRSRVSDAAESLWLRRVSSSTCAMHRVKRHKLCSCACGPVTNSDEVVHETRHTTTSRGWQKRPRQCRGRSAGSFCGSAGRKCRCHRRIGDAIRHAFGPLHRQPAQTVHVPLIAHHRCCTGGSA
jgi:hypothetical protein